MDRTYRVWYLLVLLLALAPAGARSLLWKKASQQPVSPVAAQAGEALFVHEWKPNDPLAASGDGLGPVYNATSCVACHNKGGTGGSGGLEHNVTTFTVRLPGMKPREGVVHAFGVKHTETLRDVHPEL